MTIDKSFAKTIKNLQNHCRNLEDLIRMQVCVDGEYLDILSLCVTPKTKRIYILKDEKEDKELEISAELYNSLLKIQKFCFGRSSVVVEFEEDEIGIDANILDLGLSTRLIRVYEIKKEVSQ